MDFLIENRPLLATGVSVILLLVLILRTKMHAFPALILVSIFAALAAGMNPDDALRTVTNGMGGSLGFIAVVVGLGAMFGVFLQAGGGVEAISAWLLDKMGIKAGRWAMGIVGLVVAIPVFFDVALIILAPIIFGIAKRAKAAPMSFALPLLAGLATAHAFIPPTPGPIAVAELLGADLGWVILFGVLAGAPAMLIAGPLYTRFCEKRGWFEGTSEGMAETLNAQLDADVNPHAARTAISVILIPLVLILAGTIAKSTLDEGQVLTFLSFVGHPFVALLLACGVAHLAFRPKDETQKSVYREALSKALEPAGAVILITGAGGAFKQVLVDTGAGKALAEAAMSAGLAPIVAGFVLAVLVRVAQGSATVAMITAAGLTAPIVSASGLSPAQTALVVIAIAAGASVVSHVNDSGFWLVSRYFGMSEAQTLRTWTVSVTLVGVVGFSVALLLSFFV